MAGAKICNHHNFLLRLNTSRPGSTYAFKNKPVHNVTMNLKCVCMQCLVWLLSSELRPVHAHTDSTCMSLEQVLRAVWRCLALPKCGMIPFASLLQSFEATCDSSDGASFLWLPCAQLSNLVSSGYGATSHCKPRPTRDCICSARYAQSHRI